MYLLSRYIRCTCPHTPPLTDSPHQGRWRRRRTSERRACTAVARTQPGQVQARRSILLPDIFSCNTVLLSILGTRKTSCSSISYLILDSSPLEARVDIRVWGVTTVHLLASAGYTTNYMSSISHCLTRGYLVSTQSSACTNHCLQTSGGRVKLPEIIVNKK